ncbi:Uncharacterised protein [Vibrio cholerae]|nr:Uncharacterised protein [Vibrio cholerae]
MGALPVKVTGPAEAEASLRITPSVRAVSIMVWSSLSDVGIIWRTIQLL